MSPSARRWLARRAGAAPVLGACVALTLAATASAQLLPLLPAPPPPLVERYGNPVLPGDWPDPSVIRVGRTYWAVVTSGGWRPPFTVLTSSDLVNWQPAGSVLRRSPRWALGSFWAPEIVEDGGRVLVYYSALSRRGRSCVAVASAARPAGFFHDEGPLVCPRPGAIDPLRVRDEHGRPYLLWKEDGNREGRPTPILAQPLSADGLRLLGAPRELFQNDQPWEGGVIEGPALARHGRELYLLYSARGCCGSRCDYVTGVARSRSLLGPWEKHPGPILAGNSLFHCPGHGSVVEDLAGEPYLLYHAAGRVPEVGRELMLDRIGWARSGWPVVNEGNGPSASAPSPDGARQQGPRGLVEEFRGRFLAPGWQWPAGRPRLAIDRRGGGRLVLGPVPGRGGAAVVARQPGAGDFAARAVVGGRRGGAVVGLALYVDDVDGVGVDVGRRRAAVWRRDALGSRVLATRSVPFARRVVLRMSALAGRLARFEVIRRGHRIPIGAGAFRAPLADDSARVALRVAGGPRARAAFERFELSPGAQGSGLRPAALGGLP